MDNDRVAGGFKEIGEGLSATKLRALSRFHLKVAAEAAQEGVGFAVLVVIPQGQGEPVEVRHFAPSDKRLVDLI